MSAGLSINEKCEKGDKLGPSVSLERYDTI
jgi:hypothetical protein